MPAAFRLNPLPALIAYLIVFIFSAIANPVALYVIGFLSLFHALLDPQTVLLWLRFVPRLSVFFVAFLLAGFFFDYAFPAQMIFLLRIAIFLLISAMIVRTISLDGLYRSVSGIRSRRLRDFFFYLFCTLMFIPILFREYDQQIQQPGKKGMQSYIDRLVTVFHHAAGQGDEVAQMARNAMHEKAVERTSVMHMLALYFYMVSVTVVTLFLT